MHYISHAGADHLKEYFTGGWFMNWLLAVLVLYIVIKAIWSYRRGFARMLLSMFTTFLALFLVWIFAPAVKNIILEHTDTKEIISEKLEDVLLDKLPAVITETEIEDRLPLPEALKDLIEDKLETYRDFNVHELSGNIAELLISASSYAILYLVLRLALLIVGCVLHLVTRIPGIRQMDGLAGMCLGLLESYILIGIIFILITAFAHTGFGMTLMDQINGSRLLTFIYNHNYLLRIISI